MWGSCPHPRQYSVFTSSKVKWGKEKYPLEVDLSEDPLTFKGKTLRSESWEGFPALAEGAMLMMMGSADALPTAPKEKTKFLEDMSESELASVLDVPAGLKNLGNTCYLNATLQCLKSVPELRQALKDFQGNGLNMADGGEAITGSIRDLYRDMEAKQEVIPLMMVQVLHMIFPRFAEKDDQGGFAQQDANECWVELTRMLQQKLRTEGQTSSVVDAYMGGRFATEMKCLEAPEEAVVKSTEEFLSLSCFLSQEVKYLHSGLKGRLSEEIEKHSPSLDRNAKYEKSSKVDRLPGYLTIQMIRFFFKEKDAINAKILKDVKFPLELDVFDLCTPELQAKLQPIRDRFKAADDAAVTKAKAAATIASNGTNKAASEVAGEPVAWSFSDDPGSNNSGFYSLQAILTHKGRSSNSGHYVGWVKKAPGEWLMCDDDHVAAVGEEDVLKLSGGGDWHCAYILLYGPRILKEEKEKKETDY